MAGFLDLPREVRTQIIRCFLEHIASAPTEAATVEYLDTKPGSNGSIVYPETPLPDFSAIYLVNKQVSREAFAVLRSAQPVTHDLDLVVYKKGEKIFPTWTYISRANDTIDVVNCTIRLHGAFDSRNPRGSGWSGGDGGSQALIWSFYHLITDFAKWGTKWKPTKEDQESGWYLIKKLIIDIKSPPMESDVLPQPASVSTGMLDHNTTPEAKQRLDPDALYKFLVSEMELLLNCSYHTAFYGSMLHTRIGRIEFRRDGELKKLLCLDEILSQALLRSTRNESTENHQIRHAKCVEKWAPLAQRLRVAMGLADKENSKELNAEEHQTAIHGYKSWVTCVRSLGFRVVA